MRYKHKEADNPPPVFQGVQAPPRGAGCGDDAPLPAKRILSPGGLLIQRQYLPGGVQMDYENEISNLKEAVAGMRSDVNNLIGWQKAQNGSVKEIRQNVTRLQYWIMGSAFGLVLNLIGVTIMLLKG